MMRRTKKRGFSLIEMSVVLVIMGLVTYGIINITAAQTKVARVDTTKARMNRINDAITVFFKTYNYLPCPANGTTPISNVNFGRDLNMVAGGHTGTQTSGGVPASSDCFTTGSANIKGTGATPTVYVGVVPVRTLGLPDDYMFDEYGNRITYTVSRYCTAPNNWNAGNKFKCSTSDTSVTPSDVSGAQIEILGRSGSGGWSLVSWMNDVGIPAGQFFSDHPYAAYAIISHGVNGSGAWNRTGTRNTGVYTYPENYNGNITPGGVAVTDAYWQVGDFQINEGTIGSLSYFDDIVMYRTAPQIYYDSTH